ncbi:putative karyopherin beta-1 subunit [Violaceomyces palustris]|uniref:Karyopherin beta-1 subunit n=1 Tax=Violaceomyces palustris TaxID=1673888 RepID=A0ACD0NMA0_9BASI|nr:putative karyopherin beta-1 subunit [Violaceomyces palustris]
MNARELLTNTLSPDQSIRSDAESKLEAAARDTYPQYLVELASELSNETSPVHIRTAAGLAVKNALVARDPSRTEEFAQRWSSLAPELRADVKGKSLSALGSQEHRAGTAAAQVVAAIAAIELPRGEWSDLITQLLGAMSDQSNMRLRQASLQAIGFTCEVISSDVLSAQANEILTAVIQGARKEETSPEVQLAALQALYNSLEFVRANFERDGERNYIMQVVCEATQSAHMPVKVAAYECLVRTMQLYYEKMRFYMEQALFGLTVLGMRDPEPKVALQAVEFWSTVCDEEIELAIEAEEAQEYGEEPERICYNFARIALPEIFPVLMDLLKLQDEDADEDEWDVSKAAGTCIGLLAQVVNDDIVRLAIPFIEANIKNPDWHGREAAVMCFGSIMEGPNSKTLAPLVEQALPTIIEMLRDQSVPVKDTAAWTLGRISDLCCESIKPDIHLPSLIQALVLGLQDDPRIVTNCCWAIMNLSEQMGANAVAYEEGSAPQTTPLSPFFDGIVGSLLQATGRPSNESNSRTSAYEALASSVTNCAADCLQQASNVLVQVLDRQEQLNGMANQLVGMDDRNNWAELQGNLCSVLMAVVRRLGRDVAPMGDRIMTSLLTLIQNSSKQSTVLEDALLAIGAVIAALEADFEKYLSAFLPFMVEALRNHEEYQLCSISVGLIGDICRALGEQAAKYCDDFMNALFANLQSPVLNRSVKPPILSCFGDVAMAIGPAFEPYLPTTMSVLQEASLVAPPQDPSDYEMTDYINSLREGIAEAYVGIVSGLRGGERTAALQPFVETMFAFIALVAAAQVERSEALIRGTIGLLGDLASAFPNGELKVLLQQQWISEFIKAGRGRGNTSETRKTAAWAKEMVKKASA